VIFGSEGGNEDIDRIFYVQIMSKIDIRHNPTIPKKTFFNFEEITFLIFFTLNSITICNASMTVLFI